MSNPTDAIVAAYCESAEHWRPQHEHAMACRDLEDLLSIGLSIYRTLRERQRRAIEQESSPEAIQSAQKLLESWFAPCPAILATIEEFEREGFRVAGAEELRAACGQGYIAGLTVKDSQRGIDEVCRGKTRPMKGVFDALLGRAGR